jgi:hypothetical protein
VGKQAEMVKGNISQTSGKPVASEMHLPTPPLHLTFAKEKYGEPLANLWRTFGEFINQL